MYSKLYTAVMEAMEIMEKGLDEAEEIYISPKKYSPFGLLNKNKKTDDFNKKK